MTRSVKCWNSDKRHYSAINTAYFYHHSTELVHLSICSKSMEIYWKSSYNNGMTLGDKEVV